MLDEVNLDGISYWDCICLMTDFRVCSFVLFAFGGGQMVCKCARAEVVDI